MKSKTFLAAIQSLCFSRIKYFYYILVLGLLGDIIISLDDKYLYGSCWLHGEVRQYDISDPEKPKLTAKVHLGGVIASDPETKLIEDRESKVRNSINNRFFSKGVFTAPTPIFRQLCLKSSVQGDEIVMKF